MEAISFERGLTTLKELAKRWKCSPQYLRQHATGGKLPKLGFIRLGNRLRFSQENCDQFLAAQNQQASTEQN